MKNVLFIVGSLGSGGIERQVTDLALHLKKNTEFKPVVCCMLKREGQFLSQMLEADIEVLHCSIRRGPLSFIIHMRKMVKFLKPDVVHTHVAFSLLWQVIAFKLGGAKKVIVTQQNEYQNWNSFLPKMRLRFYFLISRYFIDEYTCVSERVKRKLADLLHVDQSAFTVIHNSYDATRFYHRPSLRSAVRQGLGLDQDLFTMIVVARFARQKGHQYLIQACKHLSDKGIPFKVVLIGSGEEQIACENLVKALEMEDRFIFLGNRRDVNEILTGMDCFVLPSLWEGFGIALVEAMAVGLPVIGTYQTAMEEIIETGVSGILVNPGDVQQLQEAMLRIIKDQDLRRSLSENARVAATARYSLETVVRQYTNLYSK